MHAASIQDTGGPVTREASALLRTLPWDTTTQAGTVVCSPPNDVVVISLDFIRLYV